MKKRISIAAIALLLALCAVFAFPWIGSSTPASAAGSKPYLIDNADLLSDKEEAKLEAKLSEISNRQKFDVIILTEESIGSQSSKWYADNYYDDHRYGYGPNRDGILFLVSMEDRDWAMSTYGFGIPAFTTDGQRFLFEEFQPDLSGGNYNRAFNIFADHCDEFVTQYRTGTPYDDDNLPKSQRPPELYLPGGIGTILGIGGGVLLALIIVSAMASRNKTVEQKENANDYLRSGSRNLTVSRDLFLYSNVTRTAKPKGKGGSSGGGGGGGGSFSSGGGSSSHGGSSGKF